MEKEFLRIKEAAEYLQLSKMQMYRLTYNKTITYYKPAVKIIYFKKSDLDDYLNSGKVEKNERQ